MLDWNTCVVCFVLCVNVYQHCLVYICVFCIVCKCVSILCCIELCVCIVCKCVSALYSIRRTAYDAKGAKRKMKGVFLQDVSPVKLNNRKCL